MFLFAEENLPFSGTQAAPANDGSAQQVPPPSAIPLGGKQTAQPAALSHQVGARPQSLLSPNSHQQAAPIAAQVPGAVQPGHAGPSGMSQPVLSQPPVIAQRLPLGGQASSIPQSSSVTNTIQNGLKSGKVVSINDIQQVQNYIERCLQLYLSQKEVGSFPFSVFFKSKSIKDGSLTAFACSHSSQRS